MRRSVSIAKISNSAVSIRSGLAEPGTETLEERDRGPVERSCKLRLR